MLISAFHIIGCRHYKAHGSIFFCITDIINGRRLVNDYSSGINSKLILKVIKVSGRLTCIVKISVNICRRDTVPLFLRDKENSAAKEKLAKEATRLVTDNMTLILDSSSTVRRMCKYLLDRKGLTVITNNLRVIDELKTSEIRIISVGGSLVKERDCFVGHFAEEFIKSNQ